MKVHPRTRVVTAARINLSDAVCSIVEEHDLTYGELLSILAQATATWAAYAVRDERDISPSPTGRASE